MSRSTGQGWPGGKAGESERERQRGQTENVCVCVCERTEQTVLSPRSLGLALFLFQFGSLNWSLRPSTTTDPLAKLVIAHSTDRDPLAKLVTANSTDRSPLPFHTPSIAFRHLPPNFTPLKFISAHLSPDAVSAL